MNPREAYIETANELGRRILALIPAHPQILELEDTASGAFGLHRITGFKCDDLEPSLGQASAALAWACREYRKANP